MKNSNTCRTTHSWWDRTEVNPPSEESLEEAMEGCKDSITNLIMSPRLEEIVNLLGDIYDVDRK